MPSRFSTSAINRRFIATALRMTEAPGPAEEIVQDVFMTLIRTEKVRPPAKAKSARSFSASHAIAS